MDSKDRNNAKKALQAAEYKRVTETSAEKLDRMRREDYERRRISALSAGHPPPRELATLPRAKVPPMVKNVSKIPSNQAFPCVDNDVRSTLAKFITTDGGGSSGADYYYNLFDSDQDNLRNAAIQSSGQSWEIGVRPPPPVPVTIDARGNSIQDTYIYFDSAFKSQSSIPAQGLYIWPVSELNNANQPIEKIIEMQITEFFIPDILTLPTKPTYFFFGRVNLVINEATTQAIYGPNKTTFHWEFDVESAGISKRLIPLHEAKYIFGQPLRELSVASFQFTAPLKQVMFNQDTYLNCSPIIGTNPGIIDLGEPHHLGGPGFYSNPPSTIIATPGGAGVLGAGKYSWVVTYLVGALETSANIPGVIYAAGTFAGLFANLSTIPIGPAGVTARRIYRTASFTGINPTTYFLVTTIADNVTTVFVDNVPDGGLGSALPLVNNTGSITQDTVYISGFSSNTPTDAVVNDINGQLVSVQGDRTIVLNNTPGADFDLSGLFPVTPVLPFKTVIGYRRIAFSVRFRSLMGMITNSITPV